MSSKDGDTTGAYSSSIELDDVVQRTLKSDEQDLQRLGHRPAFKRVLKPIGLFLWSCNSLTYWQFLVFTIDPVLADGGRAGLVWSSIVVTALSLPIILSLAEMSSRAPTAGALYHWTSEFAPASIQKPLSYLIGWTSLLAYMAGNAGGLLINASLVQIVIGIYAPNATLARDRWPVIVFVLIETVFDLVVNIWWFRILPGLQWVFFLVSIACWLLTIITIGISSSPKATGTQVFTEFANFGGWSSVPLAIFASQVSAMSWAFVGYDSVAHASEETRNAAVAVPTTTAAAWLVNGVLNHAVLFVVVFAIPDLGEAFKGSSNTGYVFIYILQSLPWSGLALSILILLIVCFIGGNIDYTMSVSREVFAFARGLGNTGFEIFLCCEVYELMVMQMDTKLDIPSRAIYLTSFVSILLTLIYLGSAVAFFAIISLTLLSLLVCYFFAILSMLLYRTRRPRKGNLDMDEIKWPFAQKLGERWMRNMNIASVILLPWCIFWAPWPLSRPVTAGNFNWSSVLFAGVASMSICWYFIQGRRQYTAPADRISLR